MNTMDYLERLRALNGGCTDYRLAKLLDIKQQAMSRYRQGEREMDDEVAVRVGELLGLPPMRVVADINAARAEAEGQTTMVNFWRDAARAAGGVVKPLRVAGGMSAVAERGSKQRAMRGVAAGNGGPGRARTVDPGIMSPLL